MNKLVWMALLGGVAYALRRQSSSRAQVPRDRDARVDSADSEALDDALRDSFPASDPPSMATPHEHSPRRD